jgi:hypothetical protein
MKTILFAVACSMALCSSAFSTEGAMPFTCHGKLVSSHNGNRLEIYNEHKHSSCLLDAPLHEQVRKVCKEDKACTVVGNEGDELNQDIYGPDAHLIVTIHSVKPTNRNKE